MKRAFQGCIQIIQYNKTNPFSIIIKVTGGKSSDKRYIKWFIMLGNNNENENLLLKTISLDPKTYSNIIRETELS